MNKKTVSKSGLNSTRKTILELTHDEVRSFFLKQESYCSMDMPPYITFQKILDRVDKVLSKTPLGHLADKKALRGYDDVNYTVLSNKDGKFAWRPIQLIHPALYVALVHSITEKDNWNHIVSRFEKFSKNTNIRCLSIPVVSLSEEKDKAEQISKWWEEIEQKSFELSLDFECLFDTDLTDCYGSIYTHSIAWALHGKSYAKANRDNKSLIGNVIDTYIQDMSYGQTNGIPQGSVLMDFIAEMVLGYADRKLSQRLEKANIDDGLYCILRYRDDYRIFVKDTQTGESIIKHLTEIMIELGLKLNSSKTKTSNEIVHASMKADKLQWIEKNIKILPFYKSLMVIHEHARQFPNSGTLVRALNDYHKQIEKEKIKENKFFRPMPLIGIVVDIAYRNPKTYPVCAAILSVFMQLLLNQECREDIMKRIQTKFDLIPNTGYMEIWLQRVAVSSKTKTRFSESICRLVDGDAIQLWNSDWFSSKQLKQAVDEKLLVNETELRKCRRKTIIPPSEIALYIERTVDYCN